MGDPRKNVLVLGMARSGTSLTASIFAAAGYYLGEVMPANRANPLGYFQSEELTALDIELFRRVGFPFDNTWNHDDISEEAVDAIARLEVLPTHRDFLARFDQHAPWVWKDPRLCLTLSFWLKVIDADRTCAVLIRRDPADIYHSFRLRNWTKHGISKRRLYRRIERHVDRGRAALEKSKLPYTEIQYDALLRTPHDVLSQINRTAGTRLTPAHVNARRDLNHSRATTKLWWYALQAVLRVRPARRLAKAVIPTALVHRVFPERKYLAGRTDDSRHADLD